MKPVITMKTKEYQKIIRHLRQIVILAMPALFTPAFLIAARDASGSQDENPMEIPMDPAYNVSGVLESVPSGPGESDGAGVDVKVGGMQSLVAPGAEAVKLAGGFEFTEGPAADNSGNIYFTDIPDNRIHIWTTAGKLATFLENSEGANGLMFDGLGNLLACQGGGRKLVSIDQEGNIRVLADRYDGKKLNSPNDLWNAPGGGTYFTDPSYGGRENIEQDGEHVYYLSPGRRQLTRVIDDLVRPNGIMGTPDGKMIYVADHGDGKTYRYRINTDGSLSGKILLIPSGSDGMTMDENGNLYLTTDNVNIYSPEGEFIESITIPERPSNVCFGGIDGKTLFITARTSLYSIQMTAGGAKPGK